MANTMDTSLERRGRAAPMEFEYQMPRKPSATFNQRTSANTGTLLSRTSLLARSNTGPPDAASFAAMASTTTDVPARSVPTLSTTTITTAYYSDQDENNDADYSDTSRGRGRHLVLPQDRNNSSRSRSRSRDRTSSTATTSNQRRKKSAYTAYRGGSSVRKSNRRRDANTDRSSSWKYWFNYLHPNNHNIGPALNWWTISRIISIALALLAVRTLYVAIETVRTDVQLKANDRMLEIEKTISFCRAEYEGNKCDIPDGRPILLKNCPTWKECMEQDSSVFGRSRLVAEAFAEIIEAFMQPLSMRTIVSSY
ncbi:Di-sulfide bridge nucleocytoplasmic transport domain-containing protein [Syncephalis fuscata]|nr:Di-sulfide bridge nucleocytoplasmic transport domain-containing protein [Syncephalis fuscata]